MSQQVVIITPVKNLIQNGKDAYFKQLRQSIEVQTYPNICHLIIAGESQDETDSFLQEWANNPAVVIRHADTKNKWSAYKIGLEFAQGDYVLFLEDDMFLTDTASIEIMVKTLQENDADFTYGAVWEQPDVGNRLKFEVSLHTFYRMPFVPLMSVLCKTDVAKQYNAFNDNYTLAGDYPFQIALFLSGKKGCFLPDCLVTFRIHQKTQEEGRRRYALLQDEMCQMVKTVFANIDGVTPEQLEDAVRTGAVSSAFLKKAMSRAHPFFQDAINRKLNAYLHKFDEFVEYERLGINTIYIPLFGMGDALLFSAVAHKLYEKTGKKILVGHKNKEIFENNPFVIATDAVYDNPKALLLEDIDFLKKAGFNVEFVSYWTSYPIENDPKHFFFTYPNQSYMAQMASRCGIDGIMELKPEIYLTYDEASFGHVASKQRPQIAIMSSAISPRKQYPYFQQIVDALKDKYDFVQIGAPEDQVLDGIKQSYVGKLTIRQTAAVLSNCDLFVGELGGLMHLARAVNCPAVIAFSSSEPKKCTRYICNAEIEPKKVCTLSQKGLADKNCAPCINTKHPYCCIRTVPVKKMIKAINKMLKNPKQDLPVETVVVKPNPLPNSINEYLRRYNDVFDLDNL